MNLDEMNIQLGQNIEKLLNYFNIEHRLGNYINIPCPIHQSDGNNSLTVWPESENPGFKCWSGQCEQVFKCSLIGFVRGVLSREKLNWSKKGNRIYSWTQTLNFIEGFLKDRKTHFDPKVLTEKKKPDLKLTREYVKKNLIIPAEYFLRRGFQEKTLVDFSVGLCNNPQKVMYQRAVVPVMNCEDCIAVTGRSVFDQCVHCNKYHNPNIVCIGTKPYCVSKWLHVGSMSSYLYNYYQALSDVRITKKLILTESCGNVWRLYEAGFNNSVALFGCSLSDQQQCLIEQLPITDIILILDNDNAGQEGSRLIKEKLNRICNVRIFCPTKGDIGEMNIEEVKQLLKGII